MIGVETPEILAARRSAWYWLLAELFLTCPNDEIVARWRHDFFPDVGVNEGKQPDDPLTVEVTTLAMALPESGNTSGATDLAVEYTRLFGAVQAGYGPAPPYESVQRKGAEAADLVLAVNRSYSEAGLAPIDQAVPSDHIGVELRFVALLCHVETKAWQKGRDGDAGQLLERQREFLDRHLLQWVPRYLDVVQAEARHPFYRCLAKLARKMLAQDRMVVEGGLVAD